MALYNQIARHGGQVILPMKNVGLTAITAGLVVQDDATDTTGDLTCKAIAAADTVASLAGVALTDIAVGAVGPVVVQGPVSVLCGGAIAKGAFVQTLMSGGACDGKAITINLGATTEAVSILGKALTHSSASGDYAEIYVTLVPATTAA